MPAEMHRLENAARIAMGTLDYPAFEPVVVKAPSRIIVHSVQAACAFAVAAVFAGFLF